MLAPSFSGFDFSDMRWKQLAGIRPERARRPRPDWGSGLGRMGVFSTGVASGCTRLDATAMKPLLDASVRARARPSTRDSVAQQ